jgi:hypothetical protein
LLNEGIIFIFEFYSLFFRIPEVYLFICITCQARTQTFLEGVRILFGKGFGSRAKPVEWSRGAKPPGSRREIGKMRVKIQSPRLHFPVLFLCKIIHYRLSDYYGSHCSDRHLGNISW